LQKLGRKQIISYDIVKDEKIIAKSKSNTLTEINLVNFLKKRPRSYRDRLR